MKAAAAPKRNMQIGGNITQTGLWTKRLYCDVTVLTSRCARHVIRTWINPEFKLYKRAAGYYIETLSTMKLDVQGARCTRRQETRTEWCICHSLFFSWLISHVLTESTLLIMQPELGSQWCISERCNAIYCRCIWNCEPSLLQTH